MNNTIRTTFSVIALLVASQVSAQSADFQLEKPANIALPSDSDAIKAATTYIWPEVHEAGSSFHLNKQLRSSNEYWRVVTGAELNKGLKLHTTSDALVRLAPYANFSSGSKQVAPAIEPQNLTLTSTKLGIVKAQQIMSQEQMQTAGFNDGSVALKLQNNNQNLMLKAHSPVLSDGEYLLHIKEKDSPIKLNISAKTNVSGLVDNAMKLDMTLTGSKVLDQEVSVILRAPNGQEVDVDYRDSAVTFNQDLSYFGAHKGLYELEVNVEKTIAGQQVSRTLKFPFANTVKTASIEKAPWLEANSGYQVPVTVLEPGRFNVTATLQGVNQKGQLVRLQTVSSASWLESDDVLALPFTMAKFSQYQQLELVDIQLMDQSRMMLQQVQNSVPRI